VLFVRQRRKFIMLANDRVLTVGPNDRFQLLELGLSLEELDAIVVSAFPTPRYALNRNQRLARDIAAQDQVLRIVELGGVQEFAKASL
jgi:hypothetical protein